MKQLTRVDSCFLARTPGGVQGGPVQAETRLPWKGVATRRLQLLLLLLFAFCYSGNGCHKGNLKDRVCSNAPHTVPLSLY